MLAAARGTVGEARGILGPDLLADDEEQVVGAVHQVAVLAWVPPVERLEEPLGVLGRSPSDGRLPVRQRPVEIEGDDRPAHGSLGRPRRRSAMTLRWISLVPPAIERHRLPR